MKLVAAIASLMLLPASAGATELVTSSGAPAEPFQTWAATSHVPTPDRRVLVFLPNPAYDPCSGESAACAFDGQVTTINFANQSAIRPSVFFHELGHVYDYTMPSWKRDAFYRITGYGPNWKAGPNSAAERFAVAYSLCARGVRGVGKRWRGHTYLGRWQGEYGYSPRSPEVHRRVCHLISS